MATQFNSGKRQQDKLYKFGNSIIYAKLDGTAKGLLWFYAFVYNWENHKDSFWAQRKICALTGMSQSTYHVKRKYLEDLGWIRVIRRGYKDSSLTKVTVGKNDPNYEKMSWAEWHPQNEAEKKRNQYQKYVEQLTTGEPINFNDWLSGSHWSLPEPDDTSALADDSPEEIL